MLNDLIASIIMFIGAFYLYFFKMGTMKIMSEGSNSLLLPKIILVLLMFFSVILGIKSLLENDIKKSLTKSKNKKKLIMTIGLAIIYLWGINIVGFFILTPIFIFAFSDLLGYKNHKISITFSIALTVIVYILFIKVLYVPLPTGIGIFKGLNEFIIFN